MLGIYNSGVKVKCQSKTLTHAPVNSTVQENIRAQKSPIKGLIGGQSGLIPSNSQSITYT